MVTYSNLDILSGGTQYPNSTKITSINKYEDYCFVHILYPNGQTGAFPLDLVKLNLVDVLDIIDYLQAKVQMEMKDLNPLGKFCSFTNGNGDNIEGLCKSVNAFQYTLDVNGVNYYSSNVNVIS